MIQLNHDHAFKLAQRRKGQSNLARCYIDLKDKLAQFQESEFHPDWSLLQAANDSVKERDAEITKLTEALKTALAAMQSNIAYANRKDEQALARGITAAQEALGELK